MKLSEAIKELEWQAKRFPSFLDPDFIPALQLGIEALKRHDAINNRRVAIYYAPLPGETEE